MKNRVAALAHDNETGLDCVRRVDDLLRRMPYDNLSLKLNVLLLGSFAQWNETFLEALTTVFKHSIEFRALGRLRWPDYGDNEKLGLHISRH